MKSSKKTKTTSTSNRSRLRDSARYSSEKPTLAPVASYGNGECEPWVNPVRAKLTAGDPVIGVVIATNNVEVATHAASLGFDFIWMEMEHSPISLETVRNIVLATRGQTCLPFARPPTNELWTAKRVLDAGVLGVIFPFTRTPELARQAVQACRYPPVGLRGSGADLARVCWPQAHNYYDFADKNVLVVTVVEDTAALNSIDEIAAIPGIDVIFIGTSDLSFSLGLRGRQDEKKLDEAVAKILAAGRKNGKFMGRPARTAADIRKYHAQGFQFFMTATDLELMTDGAHSILAPFGQAQKQHSLGGM
jgi:2-keto-3-deoxy-L-rhamnonate aldolase RhmA